MRWLPAWSIIPITMAAAIVYIYPIIKQSKKRYKRTNKLPKVSIIGHRFKSTL